MSRGAGAPYVDKLFVLPSFLRSAEADYATPDIANGLALLGHFFEVHLFGPHRQKMPASRVRYAERFKI